MTVSLFNLNCLCSWLPAQRLGTGQIWSARLGRPLFCTNNEGLGLRKITEFRRNWWRGAKAFWCLGKLLKSRALILLSSSCSHTGQIDKVNSIWQTFVKLETLEVYLASSCNSYISVCQLYDNYVQCLQRLHILQSFLINLFVFSQHTWISVYIFPSLCLLTLHLTHPQFLHAVTLSPFLLLSHSLNWPDSPPSCTACQHSGTFLRVDLYNLSSRRTAALFLL